MPTVMIKDSQELTLSTALQNALTPAVRLDQYPKSAIDLYLTVLDSDGDRSTFAAAVTCAGIALAHAGIEMLDTIAAVSIVSTSYKN